MREDLKGSGGQIRHHLKRLQGFPRPARAEILPFLLCTMNRLPNSCWDTLCKVDNCSILSTNTTRVLFQPDESIQNHTDTVTDRSKNEQPLNPRCRLCSHSIPRNMMDGQLHGTNSNVIISTPESERTESGKTTQHSAHQKAIERLNFFGSLATGAKEFVDAHIKITTKDGFQFRSVFRSFQPAAESLRGAIRKRVARGKELKHLLFPAPSVPSARTVESAVIHANSKIN